MKKVILFSCAIICSSFANAAPENPISIPIFNIKESVRLACVKHEKSQECRKDLISKIKTVLSTGEFKGKCNSECMDRDVAEGRLCLNNALDFDFVENMSDDF